MLLTGVLASTQVDLICEILRLPEAPRVGGDPRLPAEAPRVGGGNKIQNHA